jgi:hypothetical protein
MGKKVLLTHPPSSFLTKYETLVFLSTIKEEKCEGGREREKKRESEIDFILITRNLKLDGHLRNYLISLRI